ncbi:hypothetical protein MYAM1_000480 [Malassezia yamatoensis]|uniref:NEDD8-activating enzyme E1 catalytic subunit n=1 Tax=Malassezia yamatoensis TaxID=253288 RepID=A0AAJ5YS29_9BASI|nr:hypothetical protein MYAM1_000480 [Malassezia yamatoensis]
MPPNGPDPSDGMDAFSPPRPSFRAYPTKGRDAPSPRLERDPDLVASYQESTMWRTPATASRTTPSTSSPGGLPSWDQAESSSIASTHSSDTPSWAPRSPPRVRTKAAGQKNASQDRRSNNGSPIPPEHLSPRSAKVVPPMPLDAIARVRQAKPNKQRIPNSARRPTSRARSVSPAAPDEPDMVPPVPPIAPQAQALANAAASTLVTQPGSSKHGRAYGSAGSMSTPVEGHSGARHAHPTIRQPRNRRATSTITIVASRPSEESIQEVAPRSESRLEDRNALQPSSKNISEQAKKRSSGENWTATFDALDSYQPEVPTLDAMELPKRRSRRGTQQSLASGPQTSSKAMAPRAPPGHLDVSEEEASSAPSHVSPSLTAPESRSEQKQTAVPFDAQADPFSTPTKRDNGSESSCSSLESQLSRPIQSPPRRQTHIRVLSRSIERVVSPDQDSPYRSPGSSNAMSPRSAMRRQALYMHPDTMITPVQAFPSPTRSMISLASLQRTPTPRGANIIPVDYGMSTSKSAPNVLAPAKGVRERFVSTSSLVTHTLQDPATRKVSPSTNIFSADTDEGPESWFAETSLPGEWDLHTPSITRDAPLLEDEDKQPDQELNIAQGQSKDQLPGDTSTIDTKADAASADVPAGNTDETVDADVSVTQLPPSSEKEAKGGMGIGAFAAAAAATAVANATKTAEAVQSAIMPHSSPQDQTNEEIDSEKDVNKVTSQSSPVVDAKDTITPPTRPTLSDSLSESIATVPTTEQSSLGDDISISDASGAGQIANEPELAPEVATSMSVPQGTPVEDLERDSELTTTQLDQPTAAPTDDRTEQATGKATEQTSVTGVETSPEQTAEPTLPDIDTDIGADAAQPAAQPDTVDSQENSAHDVNVAASMGGLASGAVLGASAGPVGLAGGAVIGAALGTAAAMLAHHKDSEQQEDPTTESSEAAAKVVTTADDSLDTPNPWPAKSDHGSDSFEDAATPRINPAATLLTSQTQDTHDQDEENPSTPTPLPDRSLAKGDVAPSLIELSDSPTLPDHPDAQQGKLASSTQPGRSLQANEPALQRPDSSDQSLVDSETPLVDTQAELGSTSNPNEQDANDSSIARVDGLPTDGSSTQAQEAQSRSHNIAAKAPHRPPPIPPTDPPQTIQESPKSDTYVAPPITMQAPLLPQLVEAEHTGEETRASTTSTLPATQTVRTQDSSPLQTQADRTSAIATAPPPTQSEHASTEDGSRPASTYSGKNPFLRSMRTSIPASVQSSAFSSGQSITQTAAEGMTQTRPVSSAASSSRPESSTFSDYQLFQEAASQLSYNESPPIEVVRPRFNESVDEQGTPQDGNQAVFPPLYESTERLPLVLDARPRRMYDPVNNAQVTSNNGSLDLNQITIPDTAQSNTAKSWASHAQPLSPLPETQPDTSNVTSKSAHPAGKTPRSMPGDLVSTVSKSPARSCDISEVVWSKMIASPHDSRRSHAVDDENLWSNVPAQKVPEAPRQPDRMQNKPAPNDIPVSHPKPPTESSKPANNASPKQTEDRPDMARTVPLTGISTPHLTQSPRPRKSPQVPEHSSAEMYQTSQFVPIPPQASPPPPEGEIEARSAWEQAQLRRELGTMQVDLDQPLEVVPVEQNPSLDYLRATSIPITSPSISQGTQNLDRGNANASSPRMEAGAARNNLEASPSKETEWRKPTSTQVEPSKSALSTSQLQKQGAADQQNSVQAVSALMTAGVDTMAGGANGPYPALNRPAQAQHGERVFAGMQPQRSLVPPFELQNRSLVLPPRNDLQWQGHPPCLECMMRDEDMIDVLVTDPAVWERESDADFYDAIRLEHQERVQNNGRRSPWTLHLTRTRVRKVAIGEPLSAANLKEHTQQLRMNSAQRAQVIHAFVSDQRMLLGLDSPSQPSHPASNPALVSSPARNEPLPTSPAPVIASKSTPKTAAPYRRASDWSVVTSKEEANRMQHTSPTKPPTDAGSSTVPRMRSTGPSVAPTTSSTPGPNLPLSVIPGAPGLPMHASPSFVANTPPRPTTHEVHNDLRPPDRPFARSQARLSPSQSLTGYASQVSLAPSASSMAHMHLAFDTPRNRDMTQDAGRAALPADDSPTAQPTSGRVNTNSAELRSDTAHDVQPDPVAADLGPQAAAFDSDSGHDVSTYSKHKRQSFRGFFRKMVTGKPPPMPTSPSHESRPRPRKPRQAAADPNESADNSWVSSSYDDSNRPHFWSKLGKKPHPTRKTSGTRPSVLTDTRMHRIGSHMNDDASANWTIDTQEDPSARISAKPFLRDDCRVLVIGAGGLGCEILANLAIIGFRKIDIIDMDTIDLSNLNRQFLFRESDVGQSKATTAAKFVEKRVAGVEITPYHGKIQDRDTEYYMQFNLVICGLDSVEARRWINAKLVEMVDEQVPESLKPLIDGGTEGFKGQARVILPTITSCYECSLDMLPKRTTYPICTIANTPRLPEHCIEWASVLEWRRIHGEKKINTDDPNDVQWVLDTALKRAKLFNIEGITWSLTQGVIKNIIPAIASTNAIIAAACTQEAFKIATSSAPYLNNYMMYSGNDGAYTYTFEYEKRPDCPVCGGESHLIKFGSDEPLSRLIELLQESPDVQCKAPSIASESGPLYFRSPTALEEATRGNLDRKLSDLGIKDGDVLSVTDPQLPFVLAVEIKFK